MANNELLKNAALAGFIQGNLDGRSPSSQTTTDYDNLVDAADAFSTQVDSKLVEDASISDVGGAALPPTTAAIQTAQIGKCALMTGICAAITSGRYYTSETAGNYDDLADVIAAIYVSSIAELET